jgi:hypothetical protein
MASRVRPAAAPRNNRVEQTLVCLIVCNIIAIAVFVSNLEIPLVRINSVTSGTSTSYNGGPTSSLHQLADLCNVAKVGCDEVNSVYRLWISALASISCTLLCSVVATCCSNGRTSRGGAMSLYFLYFSLIAALSAIISGSFGAGFGYNLDLSQLGSIAFAGSSTTAVITGSAACDIAEACCKRDPKECTRTVNLLDWGPAKGLFGFSAFLAVSSSLAWCTSCAVVCQKPPPEPEVQELAQVVVAAPYIVPWQSLQRAQIEQVHVE